MTYRARPGDGAAWVTGASAGIGRAVALELARRGFEVHATARRAGELEALACEARGFAGRIFPAPGDVTDRPAMAALVSAIETNRPLALAFLNAGGSFSEPPDDFGGDAFALTFALNVQGVANCVHPVFSAMRARGRGQIAIVGSLAGYGGLPNAGAYAPSKAAVISMAVGLKFRAEPKDVTIQIVNPGFVRTSLSSDVRSPRPFLMECDAAAKRICDGLESGGFEIRFPRRMAWLTRALQSLPYPLFFRVFRWARPK